MTAVPEVELGPDGRPKLTTTYYRVAELRTYYQNAHQGNTSRIRGSLRDHDQYKPVVVNRGTLTGRPNEVLCGNHTLIAADMERWEWIQGVTVDVDDVKAAKINLIDNPRAGHDEDLAYDERLLLEQLAALPDLDGTGYDPGDLAALERALAAQDAGYDGKGTPGSLADQFLVPPFSVLDAKSGWWRARKRDWVARGLVGDETREAARVGGLENAAGLHGDRALTGTSMFDPVLCEIAYRWWCPQGGLVLDPFAGGSVRGMVAAHLDRQYVGVDLRAEQVAVNQASARTLPDTAPTPVWLVGDACALPPDTPGQVDMVFSCPPYADLEVYSDNPRDLSTMRYPAFRDAHATAIRLACQRLKPDSFAVWVVGEARAKGGPAGFYGLVADTVHAFQAVGMSFATEAVLLTSIASATIRAARGFTASRVLTRCHQNVLIFCNGSRRRATKRLGALDLGDALDAVTPDDADGAIGTG